MTTPVGSSPRARFAAVFGAGLLLPTSACGGSGDAAETETFGDGEESLQVFAAASLTDTFSEIGDRFEDEYGVTVSFNFAGSSDLAAQIEQGAPAAVFASANEISMGRAEDAGAAAEDPHLFVANTLVIATPPQNPADVGGLADLAADEVVTVICAPQVPCGDAAQQVAERAGIQLSPASEENAVTDVLGKVRSGEADAGMVYRTDAISAGDAVETIEFDGAEEVVNNYPIAVMEEAPNAELADDFVEFVLGPEGQEVLRDAGFSAP